MSCEKGLYNTAFNLVKICICFQLKCLHSIFPDHNIASAENNKND